MSKFVTGGSDTTNQTTRVAGAAKWQEWRFVQKPQSTPNASWGGIYAQFDNQNVLHLGFGNLGGAGTSRGIQLIRLMTAPDQNTAPSTRWYIDPNGDLMPNNNASGDFTIDGHNIASDTYPMKTNFMATLSTTNLIYKAATNIVGTVVKGQMKVIGTDGSVYYIDLKQ
jgi:hypothetical protein